MHSLDIQPGQEFGPYLITRLLGRGGMGAVWLAQQPSLNREVALKVMAGGLADNPEFVARFRREAQTAASLSHPHIVSVFDIGKEEGAMYICMEYVPGEPLNALLKREGGVPPDRVAQWGYEVASALAFAHDRGILHRDVKPGNVLIGKGGHARLMDFGLAKTMEGTALTQSGMLGTPFYMAPEVGQGKPATPLSDQYALGVMLYELVAGRVPFTGDSPISVLYQHAHGELTPLSTIKPDTPAALEHAVLRMLARNSANRFPDCGNVAAALDTIRAHHRVQGIAFAAADRDASTPSTDSLHGVPTVATPTGPATTVATPRPKAGSAPRKNWVPLGAGLFALALAVVMLALGRSRDTPGPAEDAGAAAAAPAQPAGEPPLEPAQAVPTAAPTPNPTAAVPPAPRLPWRVARVPIALPNGGFVENFMRSGVALRPHTLAGTPVVTHADGRVTVRGDADTEWRAVSLRPVSARGAELVLNPRPGRQGAAGLFLTGPRGGGLEVVVTAARKVRLVRTDPGGTERERLLVALPGAVRDMIRLRAVIEPDGVRVLANEGVIHAWRGRPADDMLVGMVVYGPMTVHFERLAVRTRLVRR